MSLLSFQTVSKKYAGDAPALHEVTFRVEEGEFTALAGPSGSGKTTILNLAAGLDCPSVGKVAFLGYDLSTLTPEQLARLRRKRVGFVFQAYNLFPVLTALENVEYPLALGGLPTGERQRLARAALEEVGLAEFARRFPSQLSGGQQQRVAIARAIVTGPKMVFADEPTANLDSSTAEKLLKLFLALNEKKRITFLFSSHDPQVLGVAKRILEIKDGRVRKDTRPAPRPVLVNDKMPPQSRPRREPSAISPKAPSRGSHSSEPTHTELVTVISELPPEPQIL